MTARSPRSTVNVATQVRGRGTHQQTGTSTDVSQPVNAQHLVDSTATVEARGFPDSGDQGTFPSSIRRKSLLLGMAASVGVVLANAVQAPAAVAAGTNDRGVSVATTGATGNGVTDDTAAVRAAIVQAAGAEVYFPAGIYVLDGLLVDTKARLQLDPAATLLAKPNSPATCMFSFTGTELRIRGGTIDGNRANQTGRPVIIAGNVQSGETIDVAEVHFTGTLKAAFYLCMFSGFVSVERCLFTGQAEHTGVLNAGLSMILYVVSGEAGKKGQVRFNHNRAIGTVTPAQAGGNPGGVFISPSPNEAPLVGNMTTLEAIGNYFWGYGQNLAGNTISPIHLYHSTMGARISDNYFEECGISAICAKSVTDFVCTNNVFVGGAVNAANASNLGVISYVPGYNAGSVVQPRAVITGNIIEGAGGQSPTMLQNGISVHGTATSHGTDIIVANNIINGGGPGIQVLYVDDIKISGNIIKGGGVGIQANYVDDIVISGNTIQGGTGGTAGTQSGISLGQMYGDVLVADNVVKSFNGHGIVAVTGVNTARFTVQGNKFVHASSGYWGAVLRGMAFLKLSGNEFNATSGSALSVSADASANKVGRLAHDLSNTIVAGAISFVWPNILAATGQFRAGLTPCGVVSPGEVGTTYHQSDGAGDGILWVALGTTCLSWSKVLGGTSSGPAAANRLLGMTYDPVAAVAEQVPAVAGALSLAKVLMPGGGAVSKLVFQITTGGIGLVSGQCLLGVYSSTGALIGQTTNMSTVFATAGTKTVALSVPTAAQAQGAEVFVALLWRGTTGPKLRGISGTSLANVGITAVADYRFTTAGSALTALPATRPAPAASATAPWFGVS